MQSSCTLNTYRSIHEGMDKQARRVHVIASLASILDWARGVSQAKEANTTEFIHLRVFRVSGLIAKKAY